MFVDIYQAINRAWHLRGFVLAALPYVIAVEVGNCCYHIPNSNW
jgi:hypothetical protein